LKGRFETCPHCGARTKVYSRVVGYIQPLDTWNAGKRQEEAERTTSGRVSLSEVTAVML